MTPPRDPRLDELFVRYWDDALTDAEAAELGRRLSADPAAREWFQFLCLQAVAAAELPAVAGALAGPRRAEPAGPRLWSRRRVLWFAGAGAAACVAAGILGRRLDPTEPTTPVRLTAARGEVRLLTARGELAPTTGAVPPGATVSTLGPSSSVVLSYPDGTGISLTGDSAVTVADNGRRLVLRQGTATADVLPQPGDADPLTLATAEAVATRLSGVVMTLGRVLQGTEVGVLSGQVNVAAPDGESLGVVKGGELLTVGPDGRRKQPLPPLPPDQFAWDLTRPLPEGWRVGAREAEADGPFVRPRFWFDPYHGTEMSQIRSDHQWTRGFVRLYPDSVVRVRYRADEAGPGQVVILVRTVRSVNKDTGVLEWNGEFLRSRPRQWQELEVRVGDMLDNVHAPAFDAPWVGFQVIFNTYKLDLGLKVADFRVSRPGGRVAGP